MGNAQIEVTLFLQGASLTLAIDDGSPSVLIKFEEKKAQTPCRDKIPTFSGKKKTFEGVLNRDGQILISQLNIVKDSKTSEYRSRAVADKDKKGGWIRKEIVHNK